MVAVNSSPATTLVAAVPFNVIKKLATPVIVTSLDTTLSIPSTVLVAVTFEPRERSERTYPVVLQEPPEVVLQGDPSRYTVTVPKPPVPEMVVV